jgi:hypothetical protein
MKYKFLKNTSFSSYQVKIISHEIEKALKTSYKVSDIKS